MITVKVGIFNFFCDLANEMEGELKTKIWFTGSKILWLSFELCVGK